MYVKSISIDGFKSYAQKTSVGEFDREFNAITGLNGTGKSNILDSICFVLGITNLSQVRAAQLQDLVYKSGQAGVTKATVSILFDNREKKKSPIGFHNCDEITVTRQIVVGGSNKYMINGAKVQANKVADMFRSVQLNVNNPHFLIMQGRITKVLNMKPNEILAMIEEAAGTKMYETKRQNTLKTIEKKNARLREIDELLDETIKPQVEKLKKERASYVEFKNNEKKLAETERYVIALQYVRFKEARDKGDGELEGLKKEIDDCERNHERLKAENQELEAEMKLKKDARGEDTREQEMEEKVKSARTTESKASSSVDSIKDKIKGTNKKIQQTQKSIADDKKAKIATEKKLAKEQNDRGGAEGRGRADLEELEKATAALQALEQGKFTTEDGGAAQTLSEQLLAAKKKLSELETEKNGAKQTAKHAEPRVKELRKKLGETQSNDQDSKTLERLEKEIETDQVKLQALDFDSERDKEINDQRNEMKQRMQQLSRKVEANNDVCYNRNIGKDIQYNQQPPRFDTSGVRGVVARNFDIKDAKYSRALETVAGGKLYNIIVDNEEVGKKVLNNVRKRAYLIPLNKIQDDILHFNKKSRAEQLVGKENVHLALDLVKYPDELKKAMRFVFGMTLVCGTVKEAELVYKQCNVRTVTLEGDCFETTGAISGGSVKPGRPILDSLAEFKEVEKELDNEKARFADLEAERNAMNQFKIKYQEAQSRLRAKQNEAQVLRTKLENTDSHRIKEDLKQAEEQLKEATDTLERCETEIPQAKGKVKDIEKKQANEKEFKAKALKEAKKRKQEAQAKVDASKKDYESSKEVLESLKQELLDLDEQIAAQEEEIVKAQAEVVESEKELNEAEKESKTEKEKVKVAEATLKSYRAEIKKQEQLINKIQSSIDNNVRTINDGELFIANKKEEITTLKSNLKDYTKKVTDLDRENDWIQQDLDLFGKEGTQYDFKNKLNYEESIQQRDDLRSKVNTMKREINTKGITSLNEAEKKAVDVEEKKQRVLKDRESLEDVIKTLDIKKREAVEAAWEKISKDFGDIFSTMLKDAEAKLIKTGKAAVDGLEIRVALFKQWKDSLSELSGGQRSLVALSLVLAMLRFKPAPIYILDEVDAALDANHTQNIGAMIKNYFKESQFIIVSLKDGLFNNANVLFRTQFIDGCSAVKRSVGAGAAVDKENKKR